MPTPSQSELETLGEILVDDSVTRIMARQLRLAVITNVYKQGLISEANAKELLRGPLDPDDPSTICDDSALLDDPDALVKIAMEEERKA